MSTPPPPTPAERFAATLRWLSGAVGAQTGWGLALPVIALIINRLQRIKQRFALLAARIEGGTYLPRGAAARRPGQPPPRNLLPNDFGWLRRLLPEAVGAMSQLDFLFRDPEMAALLAGAPEPMARLLRPLCRMLGVTLPPILARPRRAPKPPAPPAAKPQASPRRSHPKPPSPPHPAPASASPAPPRICGPPLPHPA